MTERDGRPIVGIDLGGGRAWSAAVAVWPNGRTEAFALCPGIPDIREQERRDRVNPGTYERLVSAGVLESPQMRVGSGGASSMPPQQRNSIEINAPGEWKP